MMNKSNDLKIIIIDDNPAIHQDFIKILASTRSSDSLSELDEELFSEKPKSVYLPNFKIDTATQGQEGVARIKQALEEGNPYGIAFVDVRMPPGWDGVETIEHIWAIDPQIQVVMCTAYSDYSWEQTTEKLGIRDNLLILKKPFDNVTVRQLACALIKKWQLIRESIERTDFLEKAVEQRTQSLQESMTLIKATIESSTDGILVVSKGGKIVDFNAQFTSMWKISESVIRENDNDALLKTICEQLESPEHFLQSTAAIEQGGSVNIDSITFNDGRIFERYFQPHIINGITIGSVWSFRDITRRFYLEKELEYQASHDALTNLPNRALLDVRIKQGIVLASNSQSKLGILFLDIDRFKLINDSLGHEAGDQLLIEIANRLKTLLRENDTIARLGGDEFVIVISEAHVKEYLGTIANRLLSLFNQPFSVAGRALNVSTSIGIAVYPEDGETSEALLRNADLAMYKAKDTGMNLFQFYVEDMNENSLKRLEIESEMRKALVNEEFYLEYQGQYDAYSGNIVGAEALIRWKHPEKGLILPLDFIPQAEESGLIIAIGEWVLYTACAQCKAWKDSGLTPIRIAVNVSQQQLRDPTFINTLQNVLEATELEPEYLEIEVTENVILSCQEIVQTIQNIRDLGIKVALDDFGTGNASLGYLRNITFDRLKVDKSFVKDVEFDHNNKILIRSIINMARSLELDLVIEGVETKPQLDFLREEDCNNIQGYYFSKPQTAEMFEAMLKNNDKAASKTG